MARFFDLDDPDRALPSSYTMARRATEAGAGCRLGTWWGFEMTADWSLFMVVGLVTLHLALGVLPWWHPEWSLVLTWTVAVVAALAFLASVFLRELAHAGVMRRQGAPQRRTTLFLFGGVAHLEHDADCPSADLAIALVGPMTSIALGVLAFVLGAEGMGPAAMIVEGTATPATIAAALRDVGPVPTVLSWLGPFNVTLALFNLLPILPLDGGRALRAVLWALTRDRAKATRWASRAGQVIGWSLVVWGLFNMLAGALFSGLCMLLVGAVLSAYARRAYERLMLRRALNDVCLKQVMRTRMLRVTPDLPIDRFVRDYLLTTEQRAFPVERNGRLLGVVHLSDVRRWPRSEWPYTTIGDLMTRIDDLLVLGPAAGVERAYAELTRRGLEQIPVIEHNHMVGMVSRSDLLRWLALKNASALTPAPDSSR